MTAPAKIASFAAALAVVFAAALGVGNALGPNPDAVAPHPPTTDHEHPAEGGMP